MNEQELTDHIKNGMKEACTDMMFFTDVPRNHVYVEYLITVNVAKIISRKANQYMASPYKIYLEHSTKQFSNDCVPLLKREPTDRKYGLKFKRRSRKLNTSRKGKIDIAIYCEHRGMMEHEIPFCAIELKGFNPIKKEVLKDLKRNSEYFSFSDTTGESRIEFSTFAAFHKYDSWTEDDIECKIKKLEKLYTSYLEEISISSNSTYSISAFQVSSVLFNEQTAEHDVETIAEDRHLFLGIIVTFKKKC